MMFEVEVLVTVFERQTRQGERVMNLEDHFSMSMCFIRLILHQAAWEWNKRKKNPTAFI